MKKYFKRIHLWLAMPFGVIISLICFTGALMVFEREISELIRYDLYHVKEVKTQTLPISTLIDKVVPELKDSVSITGITISKNPSHPYKVDISAPRRAGIMVDQYTGEILGVDQKMPFFKTTLKLHRWLLCDAPENKADIWWGKLVVGTSTLMFLFVLISGIIAWWPKTTRGLNKQMRIHTGRGFKRFLLDVHTIGGLYACIILLAMALTGLTWSFEWYRNAFYGIFGVKPETQKQISPNGSQSKLLGVHPNKTVRVPLGDDKEKEFIVVPENSTIWQTVYAEVKQRQPEAVSISIDEEEASANLGSFGNRRSSNSYTYDAVTGKLTGVIYYTDAKVKQKVKGWVYSVHTGSWGGYLTRVLQFLAALLGAFFPITGYYLWIKRNMKKWRNKNA